MSRLILLYISLPHMTVGLVVDQGRVVRAPPIARWTVGKEAEQVALYYQGKGARVEQVKERA